MPRRVAASLLIAAGLSLGLLSSVQADSDPPTLLDSSLQATTAINSGINQPIGIVFLDTDDFLVLEKASGQVKRVIGGAGLDQKSAKGRLVHVSFRAQNNVFQWSCDAGTEQGGRNYDQG